MTDTTTDTTDADLPAFIARQLASYDAGLADLDPRHHPVAERVILCLKAALALANWGDYSGARLTLIRGELELMSAVQAERIVA